MKKRRKKDWTSFTKELGIGLSPLILALILLYIFISIDQFIVAVSSFILVITLGTTGVFIFLFKKKELSLIQFLFNMGSVILLTLVIFSFVYSITPQGENTMLDNGVPKNLAFYDAFYFSTVTLTTLGYGDIVPQGFFRVFATIEVLLGLFYLGLFIAGISHIYDLR